MTWWGGFLAASLAFTFGWGLRSLLPHDGVGMTSKHINRILMDWGACHRLLDHLQVGREHTELAPRVRQLVDYLVASSGWPAGSPPPDRFGLHEDDPAPRENRAKKRRRKS